jgi:hypothetical protein
MDVDAEALPNGAAAPPVRLRATTETCPTPTDLRGAVPTTELRASVPDRSFAPAAGRRLRSAAGSKPRSLRPARAHP